MKTQVFQLDVHDDLISIRDRMAWAKTPRILLVWPLRKRLQISPMDLALLQRHAQELGAELGIVTRDRKIRAAAKELHISVFSISSDAQKKKWLDRQPYSKPVRPARLSHLRLMRKNIPAADIFQLNSHPIIRGIVFFLGLVSVLLMTLLFIPSAEIHITRPQKKQEMEISVIAIPQVQTVQISSEIPRRNLSIIMEGTDSIPATGSRVVPQSKAQGSVILMNLGDKLVIVPAGTELFTPAGSRNEYLVEQTVEVPAGKGKNITAPVQAKLPGVNGNAAPGQISILGSELGSLLAVNNPEPITGGSDGLVKIPTFDDSTRLKTRLLDNLSGKVLISAVEKISSDDILVPESLSTVQVLEENYTSVDVEGGSNLELRLKVEFNVAYFSQVDLQLLAERLLNVSLPAGYNPVPSKIEIKPVSKPVLEQDAIHYQVKVARQIIPILEPGHIMASVLGKTPRVAADVLYRELGLEQNPEIVVFPGWWPVLPFLPMRIDITG